MFEFILDTLFSKRCVSCKKLDTYLCLDCTYKIKQTDLFCIYCLEKSIGGFTHQTCKQKFGLDGLWSLGVNAGPLKKAISALKYKGISDLADILTNILVDYFQKFNPYFLDPIKKTKGQNWIVVPVPLYWYKKNHRGYNQVELIGKSLAKGLGLEYKELLVSHGAFLLTKKQPVPQNVLLIDDYLTTGRTLKECCEVIKKEGVKKVWGVTLAV